MIFGHYINDMQNICMTIILIIFLSRLLNVCFHGQLINRIWYNFQTKLQEEKKKYVHKESYIMYSMLFIFFFFLGICYRSLSSVAR